MTVLRYHDDHKAPFVGLRAACIQTIDGPVIWDGVVVSRLGEIVAVGPTKQILSRFDFERFDDAGDVVLLPALINAHTHLELSALTMPTAPTASPDLVDWLADVVRQGAALQSEKQIIDSLEIGIEQCRRFGVAAVGDVTRHPSITRRPLFMSDMAGVSFGEVTAMAARRGLLQERLHAALWAPHPWKDLPKNSVLGVSPHAPYSIETTGIAQCLAAARQNDRPLMMHLAESPDEADFLASHTGPFRDLWNRIGGWDEQVPRFAGGPIRLAHHLGLLDYHRTLLAHVNYCDDDELSLLATGKASVVFCPRTRRYFGHPPHRWREMLARGINVCVGTDSAASAPNLNPVDDLRLLLKIDPDVEPRLLWEMITIRAARAIGLNSGRADAHNLTAERGRLAPGCRADCLLFKLDGNDPLRTILESDALPIATWNEGRLRPLPQDI